MTEEEKNNIQLIRENPAYFGKLQMQERTYEVCTAAVDIAPDNLIYVPNSLLTDEIILSALKKDGMYLYGIPDDRLTDEMYLTAIKSYPDILSILPPHLLNEELWLKKVSQNGYLLSEVPEKWRSKKMCMAAITCGLPWDTKEATEMIKAIPYQEIYLDMLRLIPSHYDTYTVFKAMEPSLINREIALEALTHDLSCYHLLSHQNTPLVTDQEYRSIKFNRHCYSTLTPSERNEALSYVVVRDTPKMLSHVPKTALTDRVIIAALYSEGDLLSFIKKERRTEEIYTASLHHSTKGNGYVLSMFPESMKTPENCKKAMLMDSYSLRHIPSHLVNEEICQLFIDNTTSLQNDPDLIYYLPFSDFCIKALEKFGKGKTAARLLDFLSSSQMNQQIIEKLVTEDVAVLHKVPSEFLTPGLILKAVSKFGYEAIDYPSIPEEYLTNEIYKKCVEHSWDSFKSLPDIKKTCELCVLSEKLYHTHLRNPFIIPASIHEGINPYTVYLKLYKWSDRFISYEKLEKLCEGKYIKLTNTNFFNGTVTIRLSQKTGFPEIVALKHIQSPQKRSYVTHKKRIK